MENKKIIILAGMGYVGQDTYKRIINAKLENTDIYIVDPNIDKIKKHSAIFKNIIIGMTFDNVESLYNDVLSKIEDDIDIFWIVSVQTNIELDNYGLFKSSILYEENVETDMSYVNSAFNECESVVSRLKNKTNIKFHIINQSTTPVGYTRKELKNRFESIGATISHSPERICPSIFEEDVKSESKILSTTDNKVKKLYSDIYKHLFVDISYNISTDYTEASKMLENMQRDVNIALMNEFSRLYPDLDMNQVINLANTKSNFAYYTPGLVGGSCISTDIFYTIKDTDNECSGLLSEVVKTNYQKTLDIYEQLYERIGGGHYKKILLLGLTYKPNADGLHNSRYIDILQTVKREFTPFNGFIIKGIDFIVSPDEITYSNAMDMNIDSNLYDEAHKNVCSGIEINSILEDIVKDYDLVIIGTNHHYLQSFLNKVEKTKNLIYLKDDTCIDMININDYIFNINKR